MTHNPQPKSLKPRLRGVFLCPEFAMRIHLERCAYTPSGTLGRLRIGETVLWTIERPWLGNKPFVSCIPQGHYQCKPYSSAKYPDTFEVVEVPERSQILFHVANFAHEVQGCIGLGLNTMGDKIAVSHSAKAVKLFTELTRGSSSLDLVVSQFMPEYP